ncbi:beta-ketoacyl-[acyl-carrier-protein] synthase family protein [Lapidilactobacillus mulanensis]|uniref:Beta-ketoacyl-[acyl-carrier-protein] synthase family protein n=1 Tax=Lapidilactobacillus mulanensis TaxID=2485999 RepID=A0ABW4DQG1_9LACO|nr:beta-ketoacyl synthase N-terminal-like domain-containing protein [Lapidilactobacillus mulanensis]
MNKRVVITGMGTVNPLGNSVQNFWGNLVSGHVGIEDISRFEVENGLLKIAGQIHNLSDDLISKRIRRKIDTFIKYALVSSNEAINDSGIHISEDNAYEIGVFVGNNSGGWDISERGFKELYQSGADMVNPWQATAWFPAAPQGYISIINNIKGFSKSFVADKSSGAMAIKFGARSIEDGKNVVAICGGTEAPITKLATVCYAQTGEFHRGRDFSNGCKPFATNNHGTVLGEGSTFLVLEELEHALKRNAHIYAELIDSKTTTDIANSSMQYERCIKDLMVSNEIDVDKIDVILPEGNSSSTADSIEAAIIRKLFKENDVTVPKAQFGHLYGASTPTDILSALLYMENDIITHTVGNYRTLNDIKLVKENKNKKVKNALIISRSREGVNVSLLLKKWTSCNERG